MNYECYDYDRQEWITGEPARKLLIEQHRQELAILKSPMAEDYCHFIGTPHDPQTLIAAAENQIAWAEQDAPKDAGNEQTA